MSIHHCIVHFIDKKPDDSPASLQFREEVLPNSSAVQHVLADLNDSYNAKPSKAWGLFQSDSSQWPLQNWLSSYLAEQSDFVSFSRQALEHLKKHVEEANITLSGHVLFAHYQQGMTDYLTIAVLQHSEGMVVNAGLDIDAARHLDLSQLHLATRINLSEWKNNAQSKQYISFLKGKNGKKVIDGFRDFLGCQEGVDGPSETRTLLKAFSDFVESEDLPEEQAREKTDSLTSYANNQARRGEVVSIEGLSEVLDEDNPQAFYNHIRNKDYGLSPEFPADKRTLNAFRRFTGRAEGISISFDSHLLGSKVEYDESRDMLIIRQLPTQLKDQLKRNKD
ncbi:nucleoid-associated protein YejK [Denitrificimonas caeni]|uniref:Nucleoid-associated protein YejK n=1 Tax=Denitrificimonas caeni TaxID=521720 RepID=A0AAF0AI42_9GAMM|nr:nucleoid-associated protein YejK [Denitrificimonas caeni]NLJ12043.1 nucleoid-associated protein YejK [Gammaproteobacteria bacterium]WBE24609.1 nucleoid-associated protein YejK [Denitrificimonas caeni]